MHGWCAGHDAVHTVFTLSSTGSNARHHGWYGSEGQLPRGVQKNGFYWEMASLCLGVQRMDFSAHAMRLPTVLWLFPQPLVSGRHFVRCLTPESRITDFSGRWHPGLFPYSALLGLTVDSCSATVTRPWRFHRCSSWLSSGVQTCSKLRTVWCVDRFAARRQGLGAEVDESRRRFFRALHMGTGPGVVSTGTRLP